MELYAAHRQWASRPSDERFPDIETLHAAVMARRSSSFESALRPHRDFSAASDSGILQLGADGHKLDMTNWSSRQFCTRVGAPPDFLAKLSPKVAADVINDRLGSCEPFAASTLVGMDDSGEVVRAFNGERYTRLWDSDITSMLRNRIPSGWRNPVAYENGQWGGPLVPSGLYASDRDMFAFLINGGDQIDLGGDDVLHQGFYVWNSEVGSKTFGWCSFMFRVVCGNNIIWDAKDVNIVRARHTKHITNIFDSFELFMIRLAETSSKDAMAAAIEKAKTQMLISPTEDEEHIFDKFSKYFTPTETLGARDRMLIEEKSPTGTAWDWLNGFTAYARTLPHIDNRNKLERTASAVLLK